MTIDLEKITRESRIHDMKGTINVLRHSGWIFLTWGAHAFRNHKNKVLRFKVNGHHHKGHVYISVNGSDLYNVYLTTTRGTMVKEMTNIYFTELTERIDNEVEKIPEYKD